MEILNDDIIGYILSKATTKTIGKCLTINKRWKQIIEIYSWSFDLNFNQTEIKNESLKYFKNSKQINLMYCKEITDIGLEYLKRVHTIDLSECNQITDDGFKIFKRSSYYQSCILS